ncbi:hypothetical protein [Streptomyces sp. NBC_01465]|uniref:hypothetical protein n=1 Tax=Streptomyces sp. NBC_01465 TaxID=2903878 RepID=UPI002E341170|nr:hypothetical protein [Streptomyces sp. NBC_01465]
MTQDAPLPGELPPSLRTARRIAVVGSPGAGKTTLARQLAGVTGLPLVHLDDLHWLPDWRRPDRARWQRIQAEAAAADRWIIDGHYENDLSIRLRHADVAVVVDSGRLRCLLRVLWRGGRIRTGSRELLPLRIRQQAKDGVRVAAHADLSRLVRTVLAYRMDRCLRTVTAARTHDGSPLAVVVVRPHTPTRRRLVRRAARSHFTFTVVVATPAASSAAPKEPAP